MSDKLENEIDLLKNSILSLKNSIDDLTESIGKLQAIQIDIFNENHHDMMRELNGSLQQLIKVLETSQNFR